ncbi:hypothetical protein SteCoe_19721 [Stentor coeruleus]|uniref:EF-hand domain-containing protein n=1 Tax=Stentor coeruleus TaxID=5963 RepID=A0A1R2BTI2_9CILI|nr:hypothetical protein SteCoe_19721 [Stentor coeruleus]
MISHKYQSLQLDDSVLMSLGLIPSQGNFSTMDLENFLKEDKEKTNSFVLPPMPKTITNSRNLYETRIKNRIRESSCLLRKGREQNSIITKSIIHATLCENVRLLEAHIDCCGKDYERINLVNMQDQYSRTSLHYAAALGLDVAVSMLLEVGANPCAKDFKNRTPMHYVAFSNCPKIVTLLLRGYKSYKSIQKSMSSNKNTHTVARLFKFKVNGANNCVGSVWRNGIQQEPIIEIEPYNFHEGIQYLLESMNKSAGTTTYESKEGKFIDFSDNEGRSALHLAVLNDKPLIVTALLEAGAKIALEDGQGKRPLELSKSKYISSLIVTKLKQNLAYKKSKNAGLCKDTIDNRDLKALSQDDICKYTKKGQQQNYLMTAVKTQNIEAVKILLSKNASISQSNAQGWNSLMFALQNNNISILKTMIEGSENEENRWQYGIKSWIEDCWKALEGVTKEGWNVLHMCSVYSETSITEYILEVLKSREIIQKSSDCPEIFSKTQITPVKKMMESMCRKQNTPFLLSVKHNRLDSVQILVSWDCNIYVRNGKLQNALHIATSKGYSNFIEYLVRLDADKNILRSQLDIQQRKPKDLDVSNKLEQYFYHIWDYARSGDFEKIEGLIEAKVYSVNEQTVFSKITPLHAAVESRQLHMIRTLVKLGADIKAKNITGKTPLDIACDMMDSEYENTVVRLLNGGKNLIEKDFSARKLNNLYTKLIKQKFSNYNSVKHLHRRNQNALVEIFDPEIDTHWNLIRKKLIEKQVSMADMFEAMDKCGKGSLNFSEFQSLVVSLDLGFNTETCLKMFKNADENKNNMLEYSEALKKVHSIVVKAQNCLKDSSSVPKLLLNKTII